MSFYLRAIGLFLLCATAVRSSVVWAEVRSAPNVVIFDGDSLVAGYPDNASATGPNETFPNGTDFPSDVMRHLGARWRGYNTAISSRELSRTGSERGYPFASSQLEDFDKTIAPLIANAHKSGSPHIIVINGGEPGNLLYFYGGNHGQGGAEAQEVAFSALKSYGDKVHKAGARFIDITMPARILAGSANANLQADIDAVNSRIRRSCVKDRICDSVIELDADPRMSNPFNSQYYVDGTHFTGWGYAVWADYVVKGLGNN